MEILWVLPVVALVLCQVLEAVVVSLPIKRTTIGWDYASNLKDGQYTRQTPLGSSSNRQAQYMPYSQKTNHENCKFPKAPSIVQSSLDERNVKFHTIYTVPIALGIPPQNFTALLDTSHSPLFVPSTVTSRTPNNLNSFKPPTHGQTYDYLKSKSSRPDIFPTQLLYNTETTSIYTWGTLTFDTLHIGPLQLPNQPFQATSIWHACSPTGEDFFSAVLGLSLEHTYDEWGNFSGPSAWMNAMDKEILNHNVFSLTLPRRDSELGVLQFGDVAIDDEGIEELLEVPILERKLGRGGWQVSVDGVSIGLANETGKTKSVLEGKYVAVVSSAHAYISLPGDAVRDINEGIGLRGLHDWVDCHVRSGLPDLTFVFGEIGKRINLSAWDHLVEVVDDLDGEGKCASAFHEIDEDEDEGVIGLGTPFLTGLYSVFDADRRSIFFGKRSR